MGLDALRGAGSFGRGPVIEPKQPGEATVAIGADQTDDDVYVLTPGASQRTGPCRWTERVIDGAVFYPAEGDPCVIAPSGEGHHVIQWWEPADDREGTPVGVSVGDVKWTARTIAPAGWLLCDGAPLEPGAADRLRDVLLEDGAPYGLDGDDPLLPDLQGRNAIGAGAGASLTARDAGDLGGAETHALTTAQMPSHTHPPATPATAFWTANAAGPYGPATPAGLTMNVTAATGSAGGGDSHPNMPPWLALTAIIRT